MVVNVYDHTYKALYYPFIHFGDEAWVTGMSQYSEGFARVVPVHDETRDGDEVRRLHDAGIVRNIYPDEFRLEAILIVSQGRTRTPRRPRWSPGLALPRSRARLYAELNRGAPLARSVQASSGGTYGGV